MLGQRWGEILDGVEYTRRYIPVGKEEDGFCCAASARVSTWDGGVVDGVGGKVWIGGEGDQGSKNGSQLGWIGGANEMASCESVRASSLGQDTHTSTGADAASIQTRALPWRSLSLRRTGVRRTDVDS